MVPKGIFGGYSTGGISEVEIRAFLRQHLTLGEEYVCHRSFDFRCIIGSIRSNQSFEAARISHEDDFSSIGAFDGSLTQSGLISSLPHLLVELPSIYPWGADGIFTCVAYKPTFLRLLSDPSGTKPFYYRIERDLVLFSSALRLIVEFPTPSEPVYNGRWPDTIVSCEAAQPGGGMRSGIYKLGDASLLEINLSSVYPTVRNC